jgi:BlaI family penicillinase repressor
MHEDLMSTPAPTEGELAILRVLWRQAAPATVHEVHAELLRSKETAYTTVLKMLCIMHEKGLVQRDESERRHRYAPLYQEEAVQSSLLNNFVRSAFAGSAFKLVQSALNTGAATSEELDDIAHLIAAAKARRRTAEN